MEANALKHLTIIHDVRVAKVGVYHVRVQILDESGAVVDHFTERYELRALPNVTKASMHEAFERAKAAGADTVEVRSNAGVYIRVPAELRGGVSAKEGRREEVCREHRACTDIRENI